MSSVDVRHGDCSKIILTLADSSIDSVVTDPPYALVSITKRFGKTSHADDTQTSDRTRRGADGYASLAKGFMGKEWDNGAVAFDPEFWIEVLRVLKPGGHIVAFGGTRTYHRLACAIEDAGFEIRDQIGWLYGSGFPKSHDVSKGIDRMNGDARPVTGTERVRDIRNGHGRGLGDGFNAAQRDGPVYQDRELTSAASAAWEGWGTALKPAWEPVVLARKPLDGTIAANVLAHGTGAMNIDACRVAGQEEPTRFDPAIHGHDGYRMTATGQECAERASVRGRWPANIIHDGSDEVVAAFPDGLQSGTGAVKRGSGEGYQANAFGKESRPIGTPNVEYGDAGSAARFFYSAKADAGDRLGSKHPTVKPVDLMAYLCRLITPPGGTILDPFAGSGTTGMACLRESFNAILIEREDEYVADIRARLAHVQGDDTPLFSRTGE